MHVGQHWGEASMNQPMMSWSYLAMPRWAHKKKPRSEAAQAELRSYANTWVEAQHRFDHDVVEFVYRHLQTPPLVMGSGVLTGKRAVRGHVDRCKALWALHCSQDGRTWAQQMDSPIVARPSFRLVCQHPSIDGGHDLHIVLTAAYTWGKMRRGTRCCVAIGRRSWRPTTHWCMVEDTRSLHELCTTQMVELVRFLIDVTWGLQPTHTCRCCYVLSEDDTFHHHTTEDILQYRNSNDSHRTGEIHRK